MVVVLDRESRHGFAREGLCRMAITQAAATRQRLWPLDDPPTGSRRNSRQGCLRYGRRSRRGHRIPVPESKPPRQGRGESSITGHAVGLGVNRRVTSTSRGLGDVSGDPPGRAPLESWARRPRPLTRACRRLISAGPPGRHGLRRSPKNGQSPSPLPSDGRGLPQRLRRVHSRED